MPLHRLIYLSRPRLSDPADIAQILEASRRNNADRAIGGMLLFTADWFLQVLEGAGDTITQCFATIANDPRHEAVEMRTFQPVAHRAFEDWGMQYVAHDRHDLARFQRFYARSHFDPTLMSADTLLAFALAAVEQRLPAEVAAQAG